MPRLKLRPRQPLVAMPRTGRAAVTSKSPSSASGSRRAAAAPGRRPSPRGRPGRPSGAGRCRRRCSHTREAHRVRERSSIISSATAPATAAIGVMNRSRCGQQAATMRLATGPCTSHGSCTGERSSATRRPAPPGRVGSAAMPAPPQRRRRSRSPSAPMMRSIGPCWKCQRPSREAGAAGSRRRRRVRRGVRRSRSPPHPALSPVPGERACAVLIAPQTIDTRHSSLLTASLLTPLTRPATD